MKKILVIGGNGSGKTTFSKILCSKLDIPLIHIDKIARTDNWQRIDDKQFNLIMDKILINDKWLIDGNDTRSLSERLALCDTVFYFDFNTFICLAGTIMRTVKNYGKQRDDVGGKNNIERFDSAKFAFFKSVIYFNKNNRKRYYDLLNNAGNAEIVVFNNRKQVNDYLKSEEYL